MPLRIWKDKNLRSLLPIALFLFLLAGCNSEPPEILHQYWQINIREDTVRRMTYEQLSLFLKVADDDGFDDLDSLYLINDAAELFWEIDSSEWITGNMDEGEGENWIGSNTITMQDLSGFPRGEYRVVLIDAAGERVEKEIYISTPTFSLDRLPFPSATIGEENVSFISSFKIKNVWVYDESGSFIKTYRTSRSAMSRQAVSSGKNPEDVTFYLYVFDESRDVGLISGPYWP